MSMLISWFYSLFGFFYNIGKYPGLWEMHTKVFGGDGTHQVGYLPCSCSEMEGMYPIQYVQFFCKFRLFQSYSHTHIHTHTQLSNLGNFKQLSDV